ncbi:uncharacterized protein ARMOST_12674 [Armillaria ostoyae]|uniref:Reverse transcriptase RNase H-like domain-containing protein n=1 Tax=Armillaria ostoyae TaxID=47428 RepID=A0A284RKM9_ARMOS|nr:uncharacterized protein ARMOST_12674 [Armillaria ostoyae]
MDPLLHTEIDKSDKIIVETDLNAWVDLVITIDEKRIHEKEMRHCISRNGIQPDSSKVDHIKNWPCPKYASNVHKFPGLICFVATFLKNLADHTVVLTPLTTKDTEKSFPEWTLAHQFAFDAIKALILSSDCLTVIDHANPGDNKIFVMCNANDWHTGTVLSWGPTWETSYTVAFDSMQLKGVQKNYPVYEKELLAIVRALKKWHAELLEMDFTVYMDHRTLKNFATQKDLSWRQACWNEFLSQFEFTINYIQGEDNTATDALSRLPPDNDDDTSSDLDLDLPLTHQWTSWGTSSPATAAILKVTTDPSILATIQAGYKEDDFCKKLVSMEYIGDHLIIPCIGTLHEDLFCLAYDCLGHFGADKAYTALHDCYYWPSMHWDLELDYIPICIQCQRNKSLTMKACGPLHPFPISDNHEDSIAMDFIGPLPEDNGFDCILTITDRLGSDIKIVPVHTDINASQLAEVFFHE